MATFAFAESRLYSLSLPTVQKDTWQKRAKSLVPLVDGWRGSHAVRREEWRLVVRAGNSQDWVGAELSGIWVSSVQKKANPPSKEAARQIFEALGAAPPTQSAHDRARNSYDSDSPQAKPSHSSSPEKGQKSERESRQIPADGSSSSSKATPGPDTEPQWDRAFPTYLQSKSGGEGDICHSFEESEATVEARGNGTTLSGKAQFRKGADWAAAAAKAASQAAVEAIGLSKSQGPGSSSARGFESGLGSASLSAPPSSAAITPMTAGKRMPELINDDPIWAAIRAEARLEAEKEPLLSSFLYASILAHSCFERSLGFVLSNRLKNATLLSTQLLDVFDEVLMQESIRRAIRADVQGYHALQAYRIAHAVWKRGQRVLALALQSRISEVFSVDIHPAARIGCGILLDHGTGVVIGETAVVGNRVSMLQGVTLGGTGKEAFDRHPKIHEGVLIGVGATILGNISVGRGAMVAAGSLVLKAVPPHRWVSVGRGDGLRVKFLGGLGGLGGLGVCVADKDLAWGGDVA